MLASSLHADKLATTKSKSEEQIESLQHIPHHQTYYESSDVQALTQEHRDYLLQRHGTLELDPLPGHGNADPYNWTQSKVETQIPDLVNANTI